MTAQDEANFICDEINEIRYKDDNWEKLPIIQIYYKNLDEIGFIYIKDDYDVISYDDDSDDFYVNDDYLNDEEY